MQPDTSKFSLDGFEGTDILGNISWDLNSPLSSAEYRDRTNNAEDGVRLDDILRHELNDVYLMPLTRSITIILWDRRPELFGPLPPGRPGRDWDWKFQFIRKDFTFTVQPDWPYAMNLWHLLQGIEKFIEWGRNKYGPYFVGHDRFGGFFIDENQQNHLTMYTWE